MNWHSFFYGFATAWASMVVVGIFVLMWCAKNASSLEGGVDD